MKRLLIEIGKGLTKSVVVYPTSDLAAINLSELKEELPDDYFFVVGDKEAVRTLINKKDFYEVLSKLGIEIKGTFQVLKSQLITNKEL